MNNRPMTPLRSAKTTVVAHRGDARLTRENTVEAYHAARAAGASWVELDARRTADDRLVVHHDPGVEGVGLIVDTLRCDLPVWIPDLEEALDACAPMGVIVEVKDLPSEKAFDPAHRTMHLVGEVLADRLASRRRGPLQVSSFFHPALLALGEAYPEIPKACLSAAGWDHIRMLEGAVRLGAVSFHPAEADVTGTMVELAHEWGLLIEPWTVNSPERLSSMVEWGADRVMTDDIEAALAAGCAPAEWTESALDDRPWTS